MAARGLADWPWNGTEVEALPPPERLLLDSFRRWRAAAVQAHPTQHALRLVLATERAEASAPALDTLLRQAPQAAIGCAFCPRVTRDEAALLLVCALAQRGARCEVLAAALRLMPLRAAYTAVPAAILAGAGLRNLGLLLRNPLREALRSPAPRG